MILSRSITGALALAVSLLASIPATAEMTLDPGTSVTFHHHDLLGSPVMVSDHKGRVLWYENTKPYGEGLGKKSSSGLGHLDNTVSEATSGLGYTGHSVDSSTGLVYMKARHYDPVIGRFYSNDPVGFTASNPMMFNRYSYANNNPYHYTDPDGRYATDYYSEDDLEKYMSDDVDILIETGGARVAGSDFDVFESRDHYKNAEGVPVVYTADLPIETMEGKEPYPNGCQSSGDASSCKREVTTTGKDWLVHGRVTVDIKPEPSLDTIESESYDFNYDPDASFLRNAHTFAGHLLHGAGHPYTIHFTGRPVGQYR